jgi:hypothetical protein
MQLVGKLVKYDRNLGFMHFGYSHGKIWLSIIIFCYTIIKSEFSISRIVKKIINEIDAIYIYQNALVINY